MQKPTVRVTQLEAFRRYIEQPDNAPFEITEQSVIDNITGGFEGNEYTRIGTAFHSIVETGHPQCTPVAASVRTYRRRNPETNRVEDFTEQVPAGRAFNIDGHTVCMDIAQCKVALEYRNEHPDAFHEFRKWYDYGDAVVTGQADMIDGLTIRDIKTKYSVPQDSDYTKSAQWRFYLEMFGLNTFFFDLFVFDGYKVDRHGYDVRGLPLVRHTPAITCYAYNGMEQDNRNLLNEFLRWADYRKLTDYLYHTKIQ